MKKQLHSIRGGQGITGAQTMGRRMSQQFNLRGGLVNNTDISTSDPKDWLAAGNCLTPTIGTTFLGGVTNIPVPKNMFDSLTYSDTGFSFRTQPADNCVASLVTTEWPTDVVVGGTGNTTVTSISVGDSCIQLLAGAGTTADVTLTTASKNLTQTYIPLAQSTLAMDTDWANLANFVSGFVQVGSDAANYYQWTITAPAANGNKILKFNWTIPNSTVGAPDKSVITHVKISITAGAGGNCRVKCSNLRIGRFTNADQTDNTYPAFASNIMNAYPYVRNSTSSERQLVMVMKSTLYIQTATNTLAHADSALAITPLVTGFTATFNSNFSFQPRFMFCPFPKTGAAGQNILYYVNGNDGYFSYDGNASAGLRHARIVSTAYKYVASHKNYMWLAGDPLNPNTLTPSILSTPGTLDTANNITLDNQDGQNVITGLVSMDDYLVIFRTKDIWILLGDTTGASGNFLVRKSLSTVGAVRQEGICKISNIVYFYNGYGVYIFDGSTSTPISEKIKLTAVGSTGISPNSVTLYYNQPQESLYVSLLTDDPITVNPFIDNGAPQGDGLTYVYNPQFRNWNEIGGQFSDATGSTLYIGGFNFASPYDNLTHFYSYGMMMFAPTNTGANDASTWNTQFDLTVNWNHFGEPFLVKDPDKLRLFITSTASNITGSITPYTDFTVTGTAQTFNVPVSTATPYVEVQWPPGLQGHAFAFKISIVSFWSDQNPGVLDFSGYALSWTEAEVI